MQKNFDLIGGKLIAGDSTKMRAQNSKKNNYNQAKIDRQLAYIDNRLQEYHQQLEQAEKEQDQSNRETLRQAIELQQQRKKGYTQLEKQLAEPIVVFFRVVNEQILKLLLLQRTRTTGVFDRSSLENCLKFETKWRAQTGF